MRACLLERLGWVLLLSLAPGCRSGDEVVVLCAASLSRTFTELGETLARSHSLHLRLEPSGSQVAARKIAELNGRGDIVAVADLEVIDRILVPSFASWSLAFAANEVVVAHREHSRHTDTITEANWYEVLGRSDVRVGLVDPDLAPIGYFARMTLQLAERHYAGAPNANGLAARISANTRREHVVADEHEVVGLLAARAVDYVLVYRSTAEDHHLKITALPATCNLGEPKQAETYRQAVVPVRMKSSSAPIEMQGRPILAGVTIPNNAANPRAAELLLDALLGERGRKALLRAGFRPVTPALTATLRALPVTLQARAAPMEPGP